MARGHIRRRSKDSFQIVASGGFNPITGHRIQVFQTVRGTIKDAERELTSLQANVDAGRITAGGSIIVSTYLANWLEASIHTSTRGRPLAPTTQEKYGRAVSRISGLLGHLSLNRLAPRHVELLRDHLLDEGKLGPDSVGDVLGILSQALNRAVSLGLVARNVASKQLVTRPSGAAKTFRLIGPDLAREILGSVRDTEWEAAVNLALGTTLRREEILGLCWTDADLENRIVRIDRALTYAGGKVHLGETQDSCRSPYGHVARLRPGRSETRKG